MMPVHPRPFNATNNQVAKFVIVVAEGLEQPLVKAEKFV